MTPELEKLRSKAHWSYSAIRSFLNCQLAYFFHYVEKREPEHTPVNLLFGGAFHAAATDIARSKISGAIMSEPEALDRFSEYWLEAVRTAEKVRFKDGENADVLDGLGRRMLSLVHQNINDEIVLSTAEAFCVPLLNDEGEKVSLKPLVGEFDLVVDSKGNPVIADWKTAARQWPADKADKDLQAVVFSYAWNVAHGVDPEFRYDVVTKTKTPAMVSHRTRRNADDYRRMIKVVRMIEFAVSVGIYLPNEQSMFCSDCVYACACANWARRDCRVVSLPTLFGEAA